MTNSEQVTKFVTPPIERLPPAGPDEIQYTRPTGTLRQGPPRDDPPEDPRRPLAIAMLANFVEDIAYGVAERGWLFTNGEPGGFGWACERFGVQAPKARAALLALLARRGERGYYIAGDMERGRVRAPRTWREGDGAGGAEWEPVQTKLAPRLCAHCHEVWFEPRHGSQRFCCAKCKSESRRLTDIVRSAKARDLRRSAYRKGNFRQGT